MPRHIRELSMCAGANIQNRLDKIANSNKEYEQEAATSTYVLPFHGYINSSGLVVVYENCRERINKCVRTKICF